MQAATKAEERAKEHIMKAKMDESCRAVVPGELQIHCVWSFGHCFEVAVMCNKDYGEMAWSSGPQQSRDGGKYLNTKAPVGGKL